MNWSTIKERLKSPVVIVQLVADVSAFVYLIGRLTGKISIDQATWDLIIAGIVAIFNTFAGLNNPTDSKNF